MEIEDLNQHQEPLGEQLVEQRVQVSKDGKWIIIRLNVNGKIISVIKPVTYFEKIIATAKKRSASLDVEKIR